MANHEPFITEPTEAIEYFVDHMGAWAAGLEVRDPNAARELREATAYVLNKARERVASTSGEW